MPDDNLDNFRLRRSRATSTDSFNAVWDALEQVYERTGETSKEVRSLEARVEGSFERIIGFEEEGFQGGMLGQQRQLLENLHTSFSALSANMPDMIERAFFQWQKVQKGEIAEKRWNTMSAGLQRLIATTLTGVLVGIILGIIWLTTHLNAAPGVH